MKKLISLIILISFLFTSSLYSAEALKAGECAKKDCVCLTIEEDTAVKKDLIELDVIRDTYKFQEEKTELFKKAYKETLDENEKLRKSKSWEKWVYLGLGVVITSAAIYGAKKLSEID